MNQASLRDQIECATKQEKRQHKQWINWWLGNKLAKRQGRARREIEAGVEDENQDQDSMLL